MAFSEEVAKRLKESVRSVALASAKNVEEDFSTHLSRTWSRVREALGRPYEDCTDEDLTIALLALESCSGETDAF
jgi:hypothetical protein